MAPRECPTRITRTSAPTRTYIKVFMPSRVTVAENIKSAREYMTHKGVSDPGFPESPEMPNTLWRSAHKTVEWMGRHPPYKYFELTVEVRILGTLSP